VKKFFINLWRKLTGGSKPAPKPPVVEAPKPVEETPAPKPVEQPPVKHGEIANFEFVDSSHHHPDFDPVAYARESRLFLNKTSQGLSMVDRTHSVRQKLCKENGIVYGGYHFFECKRSWKDQLNHYIKAHGEFLIGPIIDFETWDGHQDMEDLRKEIENLYQVLLEAERITGKRAIIYAGYHVLVALKLPEKFSRFIFWVPRYAGAIGKLPAPCTEENLMGWQFTESGKFPGLKGGNDVNIYYGKVNLLEL
jgi:lysozyme